MDFEEKFKIGIIPGAHNENGDFDGISTFPSKRFKKPENISLLDHVRLRNIGKLKINIKDLNNNCLHFQI